MNPPTRVFFSARLRVLFVPAGFVLVLLVAPAILFRCKHSGRDDDGDDGSGGDIHTVSDTPAAALRAYVCRNRRVRADGA